MRRNLIGREKTSNLSSMNSRGSNYSITFYGIFLTRITNASTYVRYVYFIQKFLSPFSSPYFDEKELTS